MRPLLEGTFARGFKRSARGNLWRAYKGLTLSVFARDDGRFSYCIADGDGPAFSARTFRTEERALRALEQEVRE